MLGIGPERAESRRQAVAGLRAGLGETTEPGIGVKEVIGLLAPHLPRQQRQRLMRRVREGGEADRVGSLVQVASRDREGPVAAGMVEERGVAVVGGLAAVGDAIGVVIGQLGQQLVQRSRMTDLVLGDRAGRDVLLEHRRDPGPLRIPEADHELVVRGAENQLGEGVAGGDVERNGLAVTRRPPSRRAASRPPACA